MANEHFSKGAAWIEGDIVPISEAKISVLDWGLTRSDITYDVVHVWEGAFFRLEDYLDRFHASIHSLRLDIAQSREDIAQILHQMVAASGLTEAYVSMVASRGVPSIPGSRDPRHCSNHFYAWAVPFVWVIKPEVAKRGARLRVSDNTLRISPQSVDPRVKNYHWGDMTKGLFEALDAGYDSAVLVDETGHITEGPGFNIFAISSGKLLTPKSGVLEGITRQTVMEICQEMDMDVEVRAVSLAEILDAEEVFLSTTGGGVTPVTRINNKIFGNDSPGTLTKKISASYWALHKDEKYSQKIKY
ncbi:MAG: aminotransferase class IV [Pseudomonadota bacterium]